MATSVDNSAMFLKSSLIAASVLFLIQSVAAQKQDSVSWRKISAEFELATYNPTPDALLSQEIILVRARVKDIKPRVIANPDLQRMTVKEFCYNSNAAVCINTNFFDENGKALGLVVDSGRLLRPVHKGGSLLNGILYYREGALRIIHRRDFPGLANDVQQATQSGPLLLLNGKRHSTYKAGDTESRRAGACLDYKGRLVLFCSAGEVTGPSLNRLTEILSMPAIACKDAINFDGGGSAQLFINEKFIDLKKYKADGLLTGYLRGQDPVPAALALSIR